MNDKFILLNGAFNFADDSESFSGALGEIKSGIIKEIPIESTVIAYSVHQLDPKSVPECLHNRRVECHKASSGRIFPDLSPRSASA